MIVPSCIDKDYSAHDCFDTWHHMKICNFFEMCEIFEIHLNVFLPPVIIRIRVYGLPSVRGLPVVRRGWPFVRQRGLLPRASVRGLLTPAFVRGLLGFLPPFIFRLLPFGSWPVIIITRERVFKKNKCKICVNHSSF